MNRRYIYGGAVLDRQIVTRTRTMLDFSGLNRNAMLLDALERLTAPCNCCLLPLSFLGVILLEKFFVDRNLSGTS